MTTTIELFKFTKPVAQHHRFMNNEQVMRLLIDEVIDEMRSPSDYENGGWLEIREQGYIIEVEFTFLAYWQADWQHFDWGYEDLGDWETYELADFHVIRCLKGNDYLEVDEQRVIREANHYFNT